MSRGNVDVQYMVRQHIIRTTCVIANLAVSLFASAQPFSVVASPRTVLALVVISPSEKRGLLLSPWHQ